MRAYVSFAWYDLEFIVAVLAPDVIDFLFPHSILHETKSVYHCGAIIGDISGSFREFSKNKYPELGLLPSKTDVYSVVGATEYGITDDSVLTFATAHTILHMSNHDGTVDSSDFASSYHSFGNTYRHPIGDYGPGFSKWLRGNSRKAYNSCGNGSAMRVSPCGWASEDDSGVLELAFNSSACTHNHPEGIKGAQATAIMISLASSGYDIDQIIPKLERMHLSYAPIDKFDHFDSICPDTMRLVINVLMTTDNFTDAVLKAVTIPNGDSDTLGKIRCIL